MGWNQHSNGSPADVKSSPPIENNPSPRKMATPPALQPTQHKMSCHLRLMWMNDMDRPTRHILQISSNFFLSSTKIIYLNYKRKIKPESKRSIKINSYNIIYLYKDKNAFKSGENVSFVFKFLFRYFFYFLRNKLTCTFQTLTAYLHEESDLYFYQICVSIAYQQVLRLLFCLGAILVTPFFS